MKRSCGLVAILRYSILDSFGEQIGFLGRSWRHSAPSTSVRAAAKSTMPSVIRGCDSLSSLDHGLQLAIRVARLGPLHLIPRISALMSQQCSGASSLLRAHKDLFESFLAARRGMTGRAKELGLSAAHEFAGAGRPFMRALALDAAGFPAEAQDVRRKHGAHLDAMRQRWTGVPLKKRLATHLTPRESEVAQLVLSGSSNREIAKTLGLSERTVHRHCESIFGRLGIHSGRQLAKALFGVSRIGNE